MITEQQKDAACELIQLVKSAKPDSSERAEHAFGGLSDEELDQVYGMSGRTCREILEDHREGRREWQAAHDLLIELLKKASLYKEEGNQK